MKDLKKIKITKNGPYAVSGNIPLSRKIVISDEDGIPEKWGDGKNYEHENNYSLCRCGKSKNKPFCDGSHITTKFDGTETADNKPYLEDAEDTYGEELNLKDNTKFCSGAGFCHRLKGTWELTKSNNKYEKEAAIQQSCNCPSGRLCMYKKGKAIEPEFEKSIGVSHDKERDISGPLLVRGKISVESEKGKEYEKRNRVTLCRCGKSKNKPFCDGCHIDIKFNDKS
jgi:CDGSH-type Zn-finger protein